MAIRSGSKEAAEFRALVEQVAALQHEAEAQAREARAYKRQAESERRRTETMRRQAQALQTVSLGSFSMLEPYQIYGLACEGLVRQLGWDTAFVVLLRAGRPALLAASGATEGQQERILDHLGSTPAFTEAYGQRVAFSTYKSQDKQALALRALFGTDEAVAMPIQQGEHLFGYLVVCSHTTRREAALYDLDFLAAFSTQIAHAAQNSSTFRNLEQQNIHLRQLDEIKDQFISITSHQLRTPLSIVKWILSILQSDPALRPLEEQRKLVDQAYASNERLIHVVNDLLNVSRIQDGKLPYNPQTIDLVGVLDDVRSNSQALCQERGVRLECDLPREQLLAELDPILFREAIQNLVDNALDYNQPQGWIRIALEARGQRFVVTVSNSGMGISKEDLAKIFDQFYRSPEAVQSHPNGNGLGLYLTRAIVQAHGGSIECSSVHGKETAFTIELPRPNPA